METAASKNTASSIAHARSASSVSRMAAYLSFAAAAASLICLGALHLLSPEFDPSWHMVSEYALGDHQWALTILFLSLAVSCAALFVAIRPYVRTTGGKIGLALLLAAGLGLMMGGLFDVEQPLHGLAFMLGVPSSALTSLLISVSLIRSPHASPDRRRLLWAAHLIWISIVLLFANLAPAMMSGAEPGPGMWFGWANRLYFLALGVWLMGAAFQAVRARSEQPYP